MDRFVLCYRGTVQNYTENKVILRKQEDNFFYKIFDINGPNFSGPVH